MDYNDFSPDPVLNDDPFAAAAGDKED